MDLSYGSTGSYDQASTAIIAVLAVGMALLFLLPGIGADGRTRTRRAAQPTSEMVLAAG
jgi:hypothetical protein